MPEIEKDILVNVKKFRELVNNPASSITDEDYFKYRQDVILFNMTLSFILRLKLDFFLMDLDAIQKEPSKIIKRVSLEGKEYKESDTGDKFNYIF